MQVLRFECLNGLQTVANWKQSCFNHLSFHATNNCTIDLLLHMCDVIRLVCLGKSVQGVGVVFTDTFLTSILRSFIGVRAIAAPPPPESGKIIFFKQLLNFGDSCRQLAYKWKINTVLFWCLLNEKNAFILSREMKCPNFGFLLIKFIARDVAWRAVFGGMSKYFWAKVAQPLPHLVKLARTYA